MKPVRFEDLEVFVYVADQLSFSEAARILGVSPVVASKAIRRLEESLGARLLVRTTRSLRLTGEGEGYLRYARAALRSLQEGEETVAASESDFRGRLRLSLPSDLGRNQLIAWIEVYLEKNHTIDVEISISDLPANLYAKPIDLAIRYGVPRDSSLICLPICETNTRVLCASPDYLSRHPTITDLSQLTQHNCLRFKVEATTYSRWMFGPNGTQSVPVNGTRVSDDAELVRRWALAGLGVAYKSELDIADDLHAGRLVRILPDIGWEALPLNLLAVDRDRLTPGVMGLIEDLRLCCRKHGGHGKS